MASLYADENFRYPVVDALRRLGHDVLTCQEAGRAGQSIDDPDVLSDASRMGRILLTQNRDDFRKLHRKGLPHKGIVICTYDVDADGLAVRITEAIGREKPGERWLASVVRPNPGSGISSRKR
jgi:predicted nuclease of predicted toxin-antitoxin system